MPVESLLDLFKACTRADDGPADSGETAGLCFNYHLMAVVNFQRNAAAGDRANPPAYARRHFICPCDSSERNKAWLYCAAADDIRQRCLKCRLN